MFLPQRSLKIGSSRYQEFIFSFYFEPAGDVARTAAELHIRRNGYNIQFVFCDIAA